MRTEEQDWIAASLSAFPAEALSPCLNIGSGHVSPGPAPGLLGQLENRGIVLVHVDSADHRGVQIKGDIFTAECQARLKAVGARSALLLNIMEHLPRARLAELPAILHGLLPAGGFLVVSVPRSFPYHADPIDTLYRPSPEELARLFRPSGWIVERQALVPFDSFLVDLRRGGVRRAFNWLFRLIKPFRRPRRWLNAAHSALWLFRPYEQSILLLRREADPQPS